MALYVITYDVRAKNSEDYQSLYDQLNEWGAGHLQNSVWLADMDGTAAAVRDALRRHLHPDDTVCVIQIFPNSDWATRHARKTGTDWLKSHTS
jgi:CRISPR/Cas system-associated endoribonuclease Cas2